MTRRVLCLWFPNWPIQRWQRGARASDEVPVLLYRESSRRGAEIAACCRESAIRGVVPGMPLAEARSLVGHAVRSQSSRGDAALQVAPFDPQADRDSLTRLAWWCRRYSPLVGLEEGEEPESLLLDITGCGHLFGGEQSLAEQVVQILRGQKLFARAAIADTLGAAWALAHFGRLPRPEVRLPSFTADRGRAAAGQAAANGRRTRAGIVRTSVIVIPPGEHAGALRSLPIEALRLPGDLIGTLQEFDLRRVGQLLALPRTSLPSRFGPFVGQRLDQALGNVEELVVPCRPPEPVEARQEFEFPVASRTAIEQVLRQLLEGLLERLQPRGEGLLQLDCRFDCAPREPVCFTVGLIRAEDSIAHLLELLRMQLERTSFSGEVWGIGLHAAVTAPLGFRQQDLFGFTQTQAARQSFTRLVERLSNRLGPQRVLRAELDDEAQPERAVRYRPWIAEQGAEGSGARGRRAKAERGEAGAANGRALPYGTRPLVLSGEPEAVAVTSVFPEGGPARFRWKGGDHTIARAWGPERVETGWWRPPAIRRDYYRVELKTGERFWLFRRIAEEDWFVSGEFF